MTVEERKQLVITILDTFTTQNQAKTHSIVEFEGIGEYDGVDAQEYVNKLRSEWDDRPAR